MFDYVTVKAPLPGNVPDFVKEKGQKFQTKSLDCALDTYEITAEGDLLLLPPGGAPDAGPQKVEYHGDIELHDGDVTGDPKEPEGLWHWVSYVARFTEGKLVRIWEVENNARPYHHFRPKKAEA